MKTEPNDPITGLENQIGLTKREYFASMAMQGILSDQKFVRPNNHDDIAKFAMLNADALIAELNKEVSHA